MTADEFIILIAERAIAEKNKYLQPGCNGPYHDPETLTRNYSHWLITFAKSYAWTGQEAFKEKVAQIAEYLVSKDSWPYGHSFNSRSNPNKDKCNGLIGQAWTFEALVEASRCLKNGKYIEIAKDVFLQHPFCEKMGAWHRLEIDGKVLSFDPTFNHQLWFAACGSLVDNDNDGLVAKRTNIFLDHIADNMSQYPSGLICHPIEHLWEKEFKRNASIVLHVKSVLRSLITPHKTEISSSHKNLTKRALREKALSKFQYKAVGYHAFNLYAFAILKQAFPKKSLWKSKAIGAALDYMSSPEYQSSLENNQYGYPYNPPGFEVPFALWALKDLDDHEIVEQSTYWVKKQLQLCYEDNTSMLSNSTEDPVTLTARLYELTRVPEEILKNIVID